MQKFKAKKKGFTLTELIIVMAIIAILAAVLIPSITGYVNKAKKSNDMQVAAHMTKDVEWYCIENDVDQNELIGTDVRTILLGRGYDLIPASNKWTFVYETATKKVVLKDVSKGGVLADTAFEPTDPTNYAEGKYLLGKGKTALEQAVNLLVTSADYNGALDKVNEEYKDLIEKFDPSTTLYITNASAITTALMNVSRIVFMENTVNVPSIPVELKDITTHTSQILKTTTTDNSYFSGLKPLDISSLEVIDIKNTVSDANSKEYKFKLGQYYESGSTVSFESRVIKTNSAIKFKELPEKINVASIKQTDSFAVVDGKIVANGSGLNDGYYYVDSNVDGVVDLYFGVTKGNVTVLTMDYLYINTTYLIEVYFANETGIYAKGSTNYTKEVQIYKEVQK